MSQFISNEMYSCKKIFDEILLGYVEIQLRCDHSTDSERSRNQSLNVCAVGKMPILFERALLLPAGSAELHRKYGERTERAVRICKTSGPSEIGAVLLSMLVL